MYLDYCFCAFVWHLGQPCCVVSVLYKYNLLTYIHYTKPNKTKFTIFSNSEDGGREY